MTKSFLAAAAALVTLAGCTATTVTGSGANPDGSVTGCAGSGNSTCLSNVTQPVNRFEYNPVNDTIQISNLPFDLNGVYTRVASLDRNGFQAYRNDPTVPGSHPYIALYARSGAVQAGVVGTGSYTDYGYGGRMFGNSGTISLPTTGQAQYQGKYAGIRVYEGVGGLDYTDGTVDMSVDFLDFQKTGAIDTVVTNRHAYDASGALKGSLPSLAATTTTANGNIIKTTAISEVLPSGSGATGTLDAIFGGAGATQVAGVLVLTGQDPLGVAGQNVKESGAFLLLKQ